MLFVLSQSLCIASYTFQRGIGNNGGYLRPRFLVPIQVDGSAWFHDILVAIFWSRDILPAILSRGTLHGLSEDKYIRLCLCIGIV